MSALRIAAHRRGSNATVRPWRRRLRRAAWRPGGLDQCVEQSLVTVHLGVPLHTEAEAVRLLLERLDGPVLSPGGGDEARVGGDRLVVMAVCLELGAMDPGDERAGLGAHGQPAEHVATRAVLLVADDVGGV